MGAVILAKEITMMGMQQEYRQLCGEMKMLDKELNKGLSKKPLMQPKQRALPIRGNSTLAHRRGSLPLPGLDMQMLVPLELRVGVPTTPHECVPFFWPTSLPKTKVEIPEELLVQAPITPSGTPPRRYT
jgi:hypothetical protein